MPKVLVALLFLTTACGAGVGTGADERERPLAVASISILADFVEAVAGDLVEVRTIVHVGGDPHVYEPVPSDARLIAESDIVFRNGLGLERWLDRLIETGAGDRPLITVTDGLRPMIQEEGEYAGDPDPHMWMDPVLAREYVEAIRDALTELLPDDADALERNADAYLEDLDELDAWIRAQVDTIPEDQRKLVTTHDAFAYFGQRYDFEIVGTIWDISTEREPSADEIRVLVDAVRASGVQAVFIETTINPRLMERVAQDAGVQVGEPLYGDSVGEPGSGAETYVGMMRANAAAIVEGLGGAGAE